MAAACHNFALLNLMKMSVSITVQGVVTLVRNFVKVTITPTIIALYQTIVYQKLIVIMDALVSVTQGHSHWNVVQESIVVNLMMKMAVRLVNNIVYLTMTQVQGVTINAL